MLHHEREGETVSHSSPGHTAAAYSDSWPGPSGPGEISGNSTNTTKSGLRGETGDYGGDTRYIGAYFQPTDLSNHRRKRTISEATLGILTSDQTGFKLPHHHFLRQLDFLTERGFHWTNLPTLRALIGRESHVTEYNIGPGSLRRVTSHLQVPAMRQLS